MIVQPSPVASHNGHVEMARPPLSESQQRMRVLDLTVDLLIARTSLRDHWAQGFQDAAKLLAAMPMPTAQFVHASRCLQNAADYSEQQEFGAAAFELRALRSQLQRM